MSSRRSEFIKVGIKTKGNPLLSEREGYTIVRNLLIGDGFHWESVVEARLPGEVVPFEPQIDAEADRNVTLINILPVESYLECVVGSEMNPKAPIEFLKAHAVISRSWALGIVEDNHRYEGHRFVNEEESLIGWDDNSGHRGFHVCSDDHCQRYQGVQEISPEALRAIRETAGEVLTDSYGNIIDARFSKCCGGKTELFSTCWQPIEVCGIESFEDPWCDLSSLSVGERKDLLSAILKDYDMATEGYGFRWTAEISKIEVGENLFRHFGRSVGKVIGLEPLHRGPSGRIDLLRIRGSEGCLVLGKELWIRRLLSKSHLYSSAFDIEDAGDSFILKGRGWGHGAGLCQIGAANMAAHGHDYKSILSFYYPKTELSSSK